MKVKPVKNEISSHRIKMMITEAQFKKLAQNLALLIELHIPMKQKHSVKKTP